MIRTLVTAGLAVLTTLTAEAQIAATKLGVLPTPSGPYHIGRVTAHWTDTTRSEPFSTERRFRELVVDIWYPAQQTSDKTAPYLDVNGFEQALGSNGLRGLLGERPADHVKAGLVQTHAVEGAPFATTLNRTPVLLFSHGSGTITQIYTAQIEDLVSHGYVVAAITHTYAASLAVLPDGRWIPLDRTHRPAATSSEEERLAYRNSRMEWAAADLRFVLSELARQNQLRSPALPFAGHLDLTRVGAFGHSAGGRAAARACQLDRRFRACANQDGAERMLPFYLDERGWGLDQPFMFIVRDGSNIPPTDEELRKWGMTRAQSDEMVGQLWARRDSTLARNGSGVYWVGLNFSATTHMSFSDLPVLAASDSAEAARQARVLSALSLYTRSFFDKTLRGAPTPLIDQGFGGEFVYLLKSYPPARRR